MTITPTTNKQNSRRATKKYFSIGEVCQILALKANQIRYAEKQHAIKVHKINNRRYYTKKEIDKLRGALGIIESSPQSNPALLNKVVSLINKLNNLKNNG